MNGRDARETTGRGVASERRARRALVGPQRDDIAIRYGGRLAASFASAGEQRRLALILVIGSLSLAAAAGVGAPVLLLDDVDSELDEERIDRVLRFVAGEAQSLVATAKESIARRYASIGRVLDVDEGVVRLRDAPA